MHRINPHESGMYSIDLISMEAMMEAVMEAVYEGCYMEHIRTT